MRGRKPNVAPFIPKKAEGGVPLEVRAEREAKRLRPRGLTTSQRRIWDRVAPVLWTHRRLHELFLDVVHEYVVALDRIHELRAFLVEHGETYESEGRQGKQIKNRPEVGQLNLAQRHWQSLVSHLKMSPATAQDLHAALADLFGADGDDDFFD